MPYFFVLNKFSVINSLQKIFGGPQTNKKIMWPSQKKGAHPCPKIYAIDKEGGIIRVQSFRTTEIDWYHTELFGIFFPENSK